MIYIAGPVTGYEDDNRQAFEEARGRLEAAGVPRVRIDEERHYGELLLKIRQGILIPHEFVPEGTPWKEAMRLCVRALTYADELVCLPGSQDSRGARLEMKIARALDIPVYGLEQYLERLGRKQE